MRSALVISLCLAASLLCPGVALASKTTVKEVPALCRDLSDDEKPIVSVADFKILCDVDRQLGRGMATMLLNAIQNTGCFRTVERERIGDVMEEQSFDQSGAVEERTAVSVGKLKGAQFIVLGNLTKFSENESGVSGGVRTFLRRIVPGVGGAAAASVAANTALVGFNIRITNPTTGETIVSKDFNTKRTTVGIVGSESSWGWAPGWSSVGASGFKSQAIADALEDGLIEACKFLVPYRNKMLGQAQLLAASHEQQPDPKNCAALASGRPPKIMVIIPEEHLAGQPGAYAPQSAFAFEKHTDSGSRGVQTESAAVLAQAMRWIRPPDPAGETEIEKRMIEYGFTVVDASVIDEQTRHSDHYRSAARDAAVAASYGARYAADIVITGEAFSEFAKNVNGMMSCRARVEAKAIDVRTGSIIAADGLHGSGLDNSELVAGKTALRNAGDRVADYFITRICKSDVRGDAIAAAEKNPQAAATAQGSAHASESREPATAHLVIKNTTFKLASDLAQAIARAKGVVSATKESVKDGTGKLLIAHTLTLGALADAVQTAGAPLKLEVTQFDGETVEAVIR